MTNNAILVGNGLNRAIDDKAWKDMLCDVREKLGVEDSGQYTNLPLEFERIYLDARKRNQIRGVYDLKKEIISSIPVVTDFSLVKQLLAIPCSDILTTNYDYYLEKAIDCGFSRRQHSSHTNERKHSMHRYIKIEEKKIWHLHGEAHCPDSICLGYDHYCTYMSAMIQYLTHPPRSTFITRKPLLRYFFENGAIPIESWMVYFFTHNIHILGITLSFLELDLWWLLSYRLRFLIENPQYKISNQIYYYYADYNGSVSDEQMSLLESMGVVLCPIPLIRKNWRKYYVNVINLIERTISK